MTTGKTGPVPVPRQVYDGLLRCQESGDLDLLDLDAVIRWLRDDGWYTAADWVEEHKQSYLDAVIQPGFKPEE